MFNVGSIYKVKTELVVWSVALDRVTPNDLRRLQIGDFINVLEMHEHHFVIQTQFGMLKTPNLNQYVNFDDKFEKVA